ncbi:hypothetical protein NPIL_130541 [Nephila pilipes]|uniref:Uncharacterized protein n=1 Tax=Nephila pilipes TaxID=299642 RepID=A0A8X6PTF5_NEPPI|nr:hypothetical protein NPIL_130541 [Nephila pilipes]
MSFISTNLERTSIIENVRQSYWTKNTKQKNLLKNKTHFVCLIKYYSIRMLICTPQNYFLDMPLIKC